MKENIDRNLIPFAKIEKSIGHEKFAAFAIHATEKTIYKIEFYEWDRFVTHFEFRSNKFANNMSDFLENQILWYGIK
jgi:hypothetical protein